MHHIISTYFSEDELLQSSYIPSLILSDISLLTDKPLVLPRLDTICRRAKSTLRVRITIIVFKLEASEGASQD